MWPGTTFEPTSTPQGAYSSDRANLRMRHYTFHKRKIREIDAPKAILACFKGILTLIRDWIYFIFLLSNVCWLLSYYYCEYSHIIYNIDIIAKNRKMKRPLTGALTTNTRNIPANFQEDLIKTKGGVSLYTILPSKRMLNDVHSLTCEKENNPNFINPLTGSFSPMNIPENFHENSKKTEGGKFSHLNAC